MLNTTAGSVLVPLPDITYKCLQQHVPSADWLGIHNRLISHVRRIGLEATVPLFWVHTVEQDAQLGIHRNSDNVDSVDLESILQP